MNATTETTGCEIDGCTNAAIGIKIEIDETYDFNGYSHKAEEETRVCAACHEYWWDGTEEHPELRPLPTA